MNMQQVRTKAKELKISNYGKMKKAELIRAIQEQEGNFSCFQSATDFCDQSACCWRPECMVSA